MYTFKSEKELENIIRIDKSTFQKLSMKQIRIPAS